MAVSKKVLVFVVIAIATMQSVAFGFAFSELSEEEIQYVVEQIQRFFEEKAK